MTLADLFKKLSYGELKNLAAAVDGSGTIKKDIQNQIVHLANEALLQLHTRFPLIQSETLKSLTGPFEMTHNLDPTNIQILSLITSWGQEIPFGTKPLPGQFYVWDRVLHIPYAVASELQITAQDRHPTLTDVNGPNDLTQTITLPTELEEALTAHIAYKFYREIRTPEAVAASNDHRLRYEEICNQQPGETSPQQKFESRGFV